MRRLARYFFRLFLDLWFPNHPVVMCVSLPGRKQLIWGHEDVGRRVAVRTFERKETAFLQNAVRPGSTVIDVGANIGYFTNLLAVTSKVLAIDANPANTALIELNTFLNGTRDRVTCINAAAAASDGGMLRFNPTSDSTYGFVQTPTRQGNAICLDIPMRSIDSLIAQFGIQKVDFVKIDIEGYEFEAVLGMKSLLSDKERRPDLMMLEMVEEHLSHYSHSKHELLSLLESFGYVPIQTIGSNVFLKATQTR